MNNPRDSFTVTISSIESSKSFHIPNRYKQPAKYALITLLVIFVSSFLAIHYLYQEVDDIHVSKNELSQKYTSLISTNSLLNEEIDERQEELDLLSSKIKNVEKLVGIDTQVVEEFKERVDVATITFMEKQFMLRTIPSGNPIPNKGRTDSYGWRTHPLSKKKTFHEGIDLRAHMKTKVKAPADGVIKHVGYDKGYGNTIIVAHSFGFETLYAHLYRPKVKIGDVVAKGDLLGLTGNSGVSSGPHLHYEVRQAQRTFNPTHFMKWTMANYEPLFTHTKKIKWTSIIGTVRLQTKIFQEQYNKL